MGQNRFFLGRLDRVIVFKTAREPIFLLKYLFSKVLAGKNRPALGKNL